MTYLSLFSGIGGFEIPLQEAGHKCVGFSEIDRYAIQVYKKHFPNHKNYGDITKINVQKLPDFDLIVGGFPCQSFSIAGKRGGFKDTRGTLFFNIAEIIKVKRPNYLLLENVKGLVSHNNGKTLEVILEILQELGYYVNIEIYNSKDFGVPQNRERIFILCRHIKTLISDGQKQNLNLSSPIINEFLFQILLNNLNEVQKLQETKSKDWVIGYLFSKEINQNLKSKDENIKDGITIPMGGGLFQSKEEEVWQNIDIWLQKNLVGNSNKLNKSTISTAIKQTIESKTYTYSIMLQSILAVIVQSRNSSRDSWKKTLLNLILIKEYTKKYARINNQEKEVIITETGNAYIKSNLQDFEKYFIVRHLRGECGRKVFPIGESDSNTNERDKKRKKWIANTITGIYAGRNARGTHIKLKQIKGGSQGMRVYDPDGLATTIASQAGGLGAKTGLYAVLTPNRVEKRQNGRRFKKDGEPMFTLTGQDIHGVFIQNPKLNNFKKNKIAGTLTASQYKEPQVVNAIRRLTPYECMKLQGFPTTWCDIGADGKEMSDSQKYKMAGNAVTTNVVKEIIKRLLIK